MTMIDSEVRVQIRRTDAFIEQVRAAIDAAIGNVDCVSPCAIEARAGLARIAATLDVVPHTLFANLANLDAALSRRTGCGLLELIEVKLLAVGGGPTLDYVNARDFLAVFEGMVDLAHRQRAN